MNAEANVERSCGYAVADLLRPEKKTINNNNNSNNNNNNNNVNPDSGFDDDSSPSRSRVINDDGSSDDSYIEEELDDKPEAEIKRARVENIIHSMRTCTSPERKRKQKRKQYCPQPLPQSNSAEMSENEADFDDDDEDKIKHYEKEALAAQLKTMQSQLAILQARHDELQTDLEGGAVACEKRLDASPAELQELASALKKEMTSSLESVIDQVFSQFAAKRKETEKSAPKETPGVIVSAINKEKSKVVKQSPVRELPERLFNLARRRNLDKDNQMQRSAVVSTSSLSTAEVKPFPNEYRPPFFHAPYYPFAGPPPPSAPMLAALRQQSLLAAAAGEPEQTEALPLVTPKKKRTKVTDTRLSPRNGRSFQDSPTPPPLPPTEEKIHPAIPPHPIFHGFHPNPLLPVSLPTSVAIPNPSLNQSDVFAFYSQPETPHYGNPLPAQHLMTPAVNSRNAGSPNTPDRNQTSPGGQLSNGMDNSPSTFGNSDYDGGQTQTLTPMHLRKAKLMFFYTRYPSSSIIKMYFPDVKFNKNNTAQLVKWFSNFREFYYIQMEKYARQAISEGISNVEDLHVNPDSELFRVLNLHYNRNNQIEVPEKFREVVQQSLREFHKSIMTGKDQEQSWKKAIYKVIQRMDESIPEYFKSVNWMDQLNERA